MKPFDNCFLCVSHIQSSSWLSVLTIHHYLVLVILHGVCRLTTVRRHFSVPLLSVCPPRKLRRHQRTFPINALLYCIFILQVTPFVSDNLIVGKKIIKMEFMRSRVLLVNIDRIWIAFINTLCTRFVPTNSTALSLIYITHSSPLDTH